MMTHKQLLFAKFIISISVQNVQKIDDVNVKKLFLQSENILKDF